MRWSQKKTKPCNPASQIGYLIVVTPDSQRPSDDQIEAWLEGRLSDEETQRVEAWFEAHPEECATEVIPPNLLKGLDGHALPPELIDLLGAQTPELAGETNSQSWRDFLGETTREDSLGTLGVYEVLEVIAKGGMGILLKAHDAKLDRYVAIKLLAPEFAINSTSRRRFLREARASAKLEHENILPIYGVYDEAVPWFAMRFIEGGSLQEALEKKTPLPDLSSLALQLASALQAAHQAGIVHRDLKPANILLGKTRIWLCDFGIAQTTQNLSLTMAGVLAGTPHYMSPEQAEGVLVDGRSDLFSLGSVLYHCATGEPPFRGETTTAVLQKVAAADFPKASQINPELPSWFENFLGNLLTRKPKDRFGSAAEVLHAIETRKSPRLKKRHNRFALLSLALIILVLLLQVPFIKMATSRLLGSMFDKQFLVKGQLIPQSTLSDAITAAKDGDTILIVGEGPYLIDGLRFKKALRIEPAFEDQTPVFIRTISGQDGITSSSPLVIRGIHFEIEGAKDWRSLFKIHSTSLELNQCQITIKATGPSHLNKSIRIINLIDGSTLKMTDSLISGSSCIPITFQDSTLSPDAISRIGKASIIRSEIEAPLLIHSLNQNRAQRQGIQILGNDCVFTGKYFYKHNPNSGIANINCHFENCTFEMEWRLTWHQTNQVDTVLDRFKWSGLNNTYPKDKAIIRISKSSKPGKPKKILSIDRFGENKGTVYR